MLCIRATVYSTRVYCKTISLPVILNIKKIMYYEYFYNILYGLKTRDVNTLKNYIL